MTDVFKSWLPELSPNHLQFLKTEKTFACKVLKQRNSNVLFVLFKAFVLP